MKALSVRAPWWWAILHGKDIENRDWSTRQRGRILLHAGKFWTDLQIRMDWEDALTMATKAKMTLPWPKWDRLKACGGCLVGSVEIVDCVSASDSPWFVGDYGFVLRNPVTFERAIPFKGALGFFEVPDGLIAERGEDGKHDGN